MPTLPHLDKEFVANYCSQSEGLTSHSIHAAVNLQDLAKHCANMVEVRRKHPRHHTKLPSILKRNSYKGKKSIIWQLYLINVR